jgi:hypothetical protein
MSSWSVQSWSCMQTMLGFVKYLVPWDDAALGHSREGTMVGKNEFALAVILEGFAPGGVGVHVVEDHDVAVAEAGDKQETACLVRVHCILQIDYPDEDVICNNVCSWRGVVDWHCYGEGICVVGGSRGINGTSGLDTLALSLHVTYLSFLQFRKIPGNVFYADEGPSAVFASSNGFEPC